MTELYFVFVQSAHVILRDAMSVEEFLASACSRKNLNPMEHFVRVKKRRDMEDHNYFVPHRTDLIETYVSTDKDPPIHCHGRLNVVRGSLRWLYDVIKLCRTYCLATLQSLSFQNSSSCSNFFSSIIIQYHNIIIHYPRIPRTKNNLRREHTNNLKTWQRRLKLTQYIIKTINGKWIIDIL